MSNHAILIGSRYMHSDGHTGNTTYKSAAPDEKRKNVTRGVRFKSGLSGTQPAGVLVPETFEFQNWPHRNHTPAPAPNL